MCRNVSPKTCDVLHPEHTIMWGQVARWKMSPHMDCGILTWFCHSGVTLYDACCYVWGRYWHTIEFISFHKHLVYFKLCRFFSSLWFSFCLLLKSPNLSQFNLKSSHTLITSHKSDSALAFLQKHKCICFNYFYFNYELNSIRLRSSSYIMCSLEELTGYWNQTAQWWQVITSMPFLESECLPKSKIIPRTI